MLFEIFALILEIVFCLNHTSFRECLKWKSHIMQCLSLRLLLAKKKKKQAILFKILWDKLGINPIWRNIFFNLQGIPLIIYK